MQSFVKILIFYAYAIFPQKEWKMKDIVKAGTSEKTMIAIARKSSKNSEKWKFLKKSKKPSGRFKGLTSDITTGLSRTETKFVSKFEKPYAMSLGDASLSGATPNRKETITKSHTLASPQDFHNASKALDSHDRPMLGVGAASTSDEFVFTNLNNGNTSDMVSEQPPMGAPIISSTGSQSVMVHSKNNNNNNNNHNNNQLQKMHQQHSTYNTQLTGGNNNLHPMPMSKNKLDEHNLSNSHSRTNSSSSDVSIDINDESESKDASFMVHDDSQVQTHTQPLRDRPNKKASPGRLGRMRSRTAGIMDEAGADSLERIKKRKESMKMLQNYRNSIIASNVNNVNNVANGTIMNETVDSNATVIEHHTRNESVSQTSQSKSKSKSQSGVLAPPLLEQMQQHSNMLPFAYKSGHENTKSKNKKGTGSLDVETTVIINSNNNNEIVFNSPTDTNNSSMNGSIIMNGNMNKNNVNATPSVDSTEERISLRWQASTEVTAQMGGNSPKPDSKTQESANNNTEMQTQNENESKETSNDTTQNNNNSNITNENANGTDGQTKNRKTSRSKSSTNKLHHGNELTQDWLDDLLDMVLEESDENV